MNDYGKFKVGEKNAPKVIVFFTSSTGDGDSPENGMKMRGWLGSLGVNALSHVFYTILGLGDSNYSKY